MFQRRHCHLISIQVQGSGYQNNREGYEIYNNIIKPKREFRKGCDIKEMRKLEIKIDIIKNRE